MKSKISRNAFLIATICAAILTGCGGGGGGSTSAEDTTVASHSLTMAEAQALAGRVARIPGIANSLTEFSRILSNYFDPFGGTSVPNSCSLGGSYTVLQSDPDKNFRLSAGDSVSLIANHCEDADPASKAKVGMDGRIDLDALDASVFKPYSSAPGWSIRARQRHSAFKIDLDIGSVQLDGSAEVEDKFDEHDYGFFDFHYITSRSSNTVKIHSGKLARKNETIQGRTQTRALYSDLVVRTTLPGSDSVSITVPASSNSSLIFGSDGTVLDGVLVLQLDNAKIIVTVVGRDRIRIDVDNNNDGVVDLTSEMSWPALYNAGIL